jgi:hypothetical protein
VTAVPTRWMVVLQGLDRLIWTADQLARIAEI